MKVSAFWALLGIQGMILGVRLQHLFCRNHKKEYYELNFSFNNDCREIGNGITSLTGRLIRIV